MLRVGTESVRAIAAGLLLPSHCLCREGEGGGREREKEREKEKERVDD